MSEYIDKEKLYQCLDNEVEWSKNIDRLSALEVVSDFEEEDLSPVIHAKWIERETEKGTKQYICSNCYDYHEFRSDSTNLHSVRGNFLYCRKCGAKMDL